jgi:exodeoxyribonuclease V beta subunit
VALHEYLKSRVKDYDDDRQFGGAFYVFLRGGDPAKGPDYSIFRNRPARALIDALSEGLVAK